MINQQYLDGLSVKFIRDCKLLLKMKQVQIDILKSLRNDARASSAKIAKELKIPRHLVTYNKQALEVNKIITGYRLNMNFEPLGFKMFVVFLRISGYHKIKKEIEGFIANHPNAYWASEVFPNFTIKAEFIAKDSEEMEKIISELDHMCKGALLQREIMYVTDILKYSRFTEFAGPDLHKIKRVSLDQKELALLKSLSEDPTSNLLGLSKRAGLSIEGVRLKLKSLTAKKVIQNFTVEYDKEKTGSSFWCQLFMRVNSLQKRLPKLKMRILKDHSFSRTRVLFGRWNLEVAIFVSKYAQLEELFYQLEEIFEEDVVDYAMMITSNNFHNKRLPEIVFTQ
jgi:DNA-binding Lrp family transcriptional regulator